MREIGCCSEEPDITTAEEKALGEYVKEHFGSDFVFITEWPWESRPFYHKKSVGEHGEPISVSADLLYKGVEIVTCAQREESYAKLCEQLKGKGLQQEGLQCHHRRTRRFPDRSCTGSGHRCTVQTVLKVLYIH